MGNCKVYDVIISNRMTEKCEKEPLVLTFVYQLICNRIMEKYKHQLNDKFKKLKKVKYKGKVIRTQRIRVRKGPKIEEVLEDTNSPNKNKDANIKLSTEANQIVNEHAKSPEWNFFILIKYIINCF